MGYASYRGRREGATRRCKRLRGRKLRRFVPLLTSKGPPGMVSCLVHSFGDGVKLRGGFGETGIPMATKKRRKSGGMTLGISSDKVDEGALALYLEDIK